MKTWAKIGVGCLVVLILCCVIGIVAVVYSGKKVTDLLGGIGGARQMAKDIKAMEQLEKDYPFTPPESGDVDEGPPPGLHRGGHRGEDGHGALRGLDQGARETSTTRATGRT